MSAFYRMYCRPEDHVFVKEVPQRAPSEALVDMLWLPEHVVCLCGQVSWGEMNARLRARDPLEGAW